MEQGKPFSAKRRNGRGAKGRRKVEA